MSNWQSLKEQGNDEFKKKNYEQAIKYYTEAISNLIIIILIFRQKFE
jgi:hypothetical protein